MWLSAHSFKINNLGVSANVICRLYQQLALKRGMPFIKKMCNSIESHAAIKVTQLYCYLIVKCIHSPVRVK
jgi:hypothetical protein